MMNALQTPEAGQIAALFHLKPILEPPPLSLGTDPLLAREPCLLAPT
jgi:hypothetical protein